jgi:hypothetical protein
LTAATSSSWSSKYLDSEMSSATISATPHAHRQRGGFDGDSALLLVGACICVARGPCVAGGNDPGFGDERVRKRRFSVVHCASQTQRKRE